MVADHRSESFLRAKYWDEGKSQAEIADELDIIRRTVGKWMKKHNIETRSRSESQSEGNAEKLKDGEWLRQEYKNKQKSQAEIAEELGVSHRSVGRWMEKHGIEVRSKSERHSEGDIGKLRNEEWVREQYENQQKTTYEIADELNVCDRTVGKWLKRHGIEVRSKSERESDGDIGKLMDEKWLREQYQNQERSTFDIADELEVDSSSVRRWMEKHGIEARSYSEIQSKRNVEELRDEEWLREQYENQQKTTYEIADELNVCDRTVGRWLNKHGISIRSPITNPEYTAHIVRSEWELEMCNILIEEGVDYNYESLGIEYCEGSTYVPDFVTDEYVIEVKGAYFSEIHNHKNTEREKALAAMESLDERDYVVVGKELPADIHIPWEERSKIRELLSNA